MAYQLIGDLSIILVWVFSGCNRSDDPSRDVPLRSPGPCPAWADTLYRCPDADASDSDTDLDDDRYDRDVSQTRTDAIPDPRSLDSTINDVITLGDDTTRLPS